MMGLDDELRAAHEAGDGATLVQLYTSAADQVEHSDINAACFYLTHAYVFALELADPACATLRARLVRHGREPAD
ncbi:MAG: hypothetical protein WA790_13040 [Sulfitobacter sp.]